MSKIREPKGKIVRRFGFNIFESPKFSRLLERRPMRQVGRKRKRGGESEYSRQLIEKQKLKFHYSLNERQFRTVFEEASKLPGQTGFTALLMLERRLDNIVYLLGMSSTRSQARQTVNHRHILVNGKGVNIPSYIVKPGDTIKVSERKESKKLLQTLIAENANRTVPEWLSLSKAEMVGQVVRLPSREEIPTVADENLVVEFYTR